MADILKLEKAMEGLIKEMDFIRLDISKSRERYLNTGAYNRAALARLRKSLIRFSKIGLEFRKESVVYTKALKQKQREEFKDGYQATVKR